MFIYLRLVDNDYGTEMSRFGDDLLYNYGKSLLTMSEDEIKKKAVTFIAGYSTYLTVDRKDKTPQENFLGLMEYLSEGITIIKSNHWPDETYTKYGSDDDGGSLVIDVYGGKSYRV